MRASRVGMRNRLGTVVASERDESEVDMSSCIDVLGLASLGFVLLDVGIIVH